jgi:hypothetical protein
MSATEALWEQQKLPIKDGLYMVSGESVAVELDSSTASGIIFESHFDLDAMLRDDPECVTTLDVAREIDLKGNGRLCCGEGSYGSEGFFARTGSDGGLMWAMYFEGSNPFVSISQRAGRATFLSTSGVKITVDVDDPRHR